MDDISYWNNPKEFFKKVTPGTLFFIVALVLIFVGALIPGFNLLLKLGLVIIGFFVIVWIFWIFFQVYEG